MFPGHCKEVSVRSVAFELTEDNIKGFLSGKRAYIRTRFYVFSSGDQWAVAEVEKDEANSVLKGIRSVRVLSLPDDTAFVDDPSLEVLSASVMGALQRQTGRRCVVVRGRADHISFFLEEEPRMLTIFDVVPPSPSKLVGMVDSVLESDLQDMCVSYSVVEADLNDIAASVTSGSVMFPCRASALRSRLPTYYLDETRELTEQQIADVTLVGCSLSARIFKAVYGSEPRLVNMCPKDLARAKGVEGPVLVKCCRVKEGFEVDGDMAVVPWGVRSSELAAALRALLS
ncbi:MAG: hypothetical protein AB1793_03645 [Candidatus Thermoplasmatota archaeon]